MNSDIRLRNVEFIPKILDEGILYVSRRFNVAAHICPCGCGTKVITPLGPCEWTLSEKKGKPTLDPSIGNWQIPCRSHYWITNGDIEWSYSWTDEQVENKHKMDQTKLESYYRKKNKSGKISLWKRLKNWILNAEGHR